MTIDAADPTENQRSKLRRLVLMRHAKSDWADGSLADHDRPLNARGRSDAPMMALWLQEMVVVPDVVLTSSSKRTRETLDLMLQEWPVEPRVSVLETLYLASAETIIQTIHRSGGDAMTLLVLAHNPGMADLVSELANKFMDMPTAAVAVFEVKRDGWKSLAGSDDVRLIDFMRPKALQ